MCPEERKTEGLVAELSVRENIVLALQARTGLAAAPVSQAAAGDRGALRQGARHQDRRRSTRRSAQLSGGNQQKVLLARWLATEPRFLILDEPTRGVDVAAQQEIMNEIVALARDGMAVMFISAEIEEVVRLSDRVVVMRDRRKAGELPGGCDEHAVYELDLAQARHEAPDPARRCSGRAGHAGVAAGDQRDCESGLSASRVGRRAPAAAISSTC